MRSLKIVRKYRRVKRTARRTGIAALLAAIIAIGTGGCEWGTPDGQITEIEQGENGVKIEYHMEEVAADDEGDESREVYLGRGHACAEGDLIQDCARPGDLLVQQAQQDPDTFTSCVAAEALNSTPLYRNSRGFDPKLDDDGDGVACEPGE